MANSKITTVNISKKILRDICDFYKTTNISEAVRNALADFLLLPFKMQDLDTFPLHQITTIEKRFEKTTISLRLPAELFQILCRISEELTIQETVEIMLAKFIYIASFEKDCKSDLHLLRVMGSKWDERMQNAIRNILESSGIKWEVSVEPCAGALGIHSNFQFAEMEILNDDDFNKINLYRCIQKYPRELIVSARSLSVSKEQFENIKKMKSVPSKKADINAAANYLYLNLTSFRNEGSCLLDNMTDKRYQNLLSAIFPLHKRLAKTQLCEMDLFKIIGKCRKTENCIFIVDPPYLNTNVYKGRNVRKEEEHGKEFGLNEHQKLAKLLRLIKKNNDNDFIYFCRITATRKKNKKNEIVLTTDEIERNDRHMLGSIDDLYFGHGFFYTDIELDDGTLERIITSFSFNNSIPYG